MQFDPSVGVLNVGDTVHWYIKILCEIDLQTYRSFRIAHYLSLFGLPWGI